MTSTMTLRLCLTVRVLARNTADIQSTAEASKTIELVLTKVLQGMLIRAVETLRVVAKASVEAFGQRMTDSAKIMSHY